MYRQLILFAALVTVTMLPATAPAQSARTTTLPTSRMLSRFGLERAWWSQATLDVNRDEVRHLVLDQDAFYVQSSGGIVTAFDSENGRKLWAVQLGRRDTPSFAAVSNDNQVMVVAGMTLYTLNKFDGQLLWQLRLVKTPSTSPAADNEQLYYGALDGSVYAYDLQKIQELHEDNLLPQWTQVARQWRFKAADEITTQPVVGERTINFASRDNSLYALTPSDRTMQWQFETDQPVSAPLGESRGFVYLASQDFNVFCIDKNTGSVRWQFVAGLPVRREVRIIGTNVYVFPHRGGVYCLSRVSGRRRWWRPRIVDFVASTKDMLFVTDSLGQITVLSPDDGAELGALPLKDFSVRYGNELTDRIYLSTESGLTVCIREQGREFPIFHRFPERQPILPLFAPPEDTEEGAASGS